MGIELFILLPTLSYHKCVFYICVRTNFFSFAVNACSNAGVTTISNINYCRSSQNGNFIPLCEADGLQWKGSKSYLRSIYFINTFIFYTRIYSTNTTIFSFFFFLPRHAFFFSIVLYWVVIRISCRQSLNIETFDLSLKHLFLAVGQLGCQLIS